MNMQVDVMFCILYACTFQLCESIFHSRNNLRINGAIRHRSARASHGTRPDTYDVIRLLKALFTTIQSKLSFYSGLFEEELTLLMHLIKIETSNLVLL